MDPDALDLARRNAQDAGVEIELREGSLLEPFAPGEYADLLATNLPHKPCRAQGELPLAQDGGPEGDALFSSLFEQATEQLPAGSRIVFFLHSLAHPRLLAGLTGNYRLRLLAWKRRFLAPGEYGELQGWFAERHHAGTSYLGCDDGARYLVACVWLATRL